MVRIIPYQIELSQSLPIVEGNIDYHNFKEIVERIDELLIISGIEIDAMRSAIEKAEKENPNGLDEKQQIRIQRRVKTGLRCTILKELTGEAYRPFSFKLADSPLFQKFCLIERLDKVKVPSKSTLERFEKMFEEEKIREFTTSLIKAASNIESTEKMKQELLLEKAVSLSDYYLDTTCVKGNIHYPVDWVLLRDGTRTLMKAIILIRRQGLKNRMDSPKMFIKDMNKLSIQMTQARNAKESKKERKRILRVMKKMMKKIKNHAEKHIDLLKSNWKETELTENQAKRIIERMENVITKLPEAIRQAHERIIGGRKVKNEEKILSLYEDNIHVVVRKKAEAMVEFGNKVLIGEQANGLIVDWQMYKDKVPGDKSLLTESLLRFKNTYGQYPENASGDRGFFTKKNQKFLEGNQIKDYICPISPNQLKERLKEKDFVEHQTRRAQTEARIGIIKNNFIGSPLRSKGSVNRERSISWAILVHNLWVLARLPRVEEENETGLKKTA